MRIISIFYYFKTKIIIIITHVHSYCKSTVIFVYTYIYNIWIILIVATEQGISGVADSVVTFAFLKPIRS